MDRSRPGMTPVAPWNHEAVRSQNPNRLEEPENPGPETLPARRYLSVSFTEAVDGCGGPCPNGSAAPHHLRIDSHEMTDAPRAEDAAFLVTGQQVYRGESMPVPTENRATFAGGNEAAGSCSIALSIRRLARPGRWWTL